MYTPNANVIICASRFERIIHPFAKNLSVIFDTDLNFEKQVSAVVKSRFFQLRQIAKLKSMLSFKDLEIVTHAFITSRLHYCNALYMGLNHSSLNRLQLVQNAAVRLLMVLRGEKAFLQS